MTTLGRSSGDVDLFTDEQGNLAAPTGIIRVGNEMWFTSIGNARIGRIQTDSGRIETFADPAGQVALPANIHPGSDGRVWFTCLGSNRLGAIDPAAADPAASIQTYPDPALDRPVALKAAPDGRLWCTLRGSNAVASFDPRADPPLSSLVTFTASSISEPSALFAHPDGSVWWVNAGRQTVGRLDLAHSGPAHPDPADPDPADSDPGEQVVEFGPWPHWGAPRAWAIDGDGRLWVSTQDRPGVLCLDPGAEDVAGTARWHTDDRLQTPDGIWCGPDEALWLADTQARTIVRFDPSRPGATAWSSFGAQAGLRGPFDIKTGGRPDDENLWFTDKDGNAIGRVAV